MVKKLIVFDLDGTLAASERWQMQLSEECR